MRLFFFLIVLLLSVKGFAQNQDDPLRMVSVSKSDREMLYRSILKIESRDSIGSALIIRSLLLDEKDNSYKLVTGIYSFSFMGPHFQPYLFIYSNNRIQVITNYSIENLLSELKSFFDENKKMPFDKKIKYVETALEIIKIRKAF